MVEQESSEIESIAGDERYESSVNAESKDELGKLGSRMDQDEEDRKTDRALRKEHSAKALELVKRVLFWGFAMAFITGFEYRQPTGASWHFHPSIYYMLGVFAGAALAVYGWVAKGLFPSFGGSGK